MPGLTGHLTTPTVIPNVLNRHARLDLNVMPDLIGHLNIGQHQRRYLRVCVLSMRSTVMMDRMADGRSCP